MGRLLGTLLRHAHCCVSSYQSNSWFSARTTSVGVKFQMTQFIRSLLPFCYYCTNFGTRWSRPMSGFVFVLAAHTYIFLIQVVTSQSNLTTLGGFVWFTCSTHAHLFNASCHFAVWSCRLEFCCTSNMQIYLFDACSRFVVLWCYLELLSVFTNRTQAQIFSAFNLSLGGHIIPTWVCLYVLTLFNATCHFLSNYTTLCDLMFVLAAIKTTPIPEKLSSNQEKSSKNLSR